MAKIKSSIASGPGFYFAIPAVIFYFVFFIAPTVVSLLLSFTDWTSYSSEINFIGIQNFIRLINEGTLLKVTRNTALFTIAIVILDNVVAFLLALALAKRTRFTVFFRALFFSPCLIAIIVWGYLFKNIFNMRGILNQVLSFVLNTKVTIQWLGSTQYSIFTAAFVVGWMWIGFHMMIYIASINAIPEDIIEAARIDGVNYFTMVGRIIIPLVMSSVTFNVLTSTIGGLRVFDVIWVLTQRGPGGSTETFNTWIFDTYARGFFGYSSAMNIIMITAIMIIAVPLYTSLSRKVVEL